MSSVRDSTPGRQAVEAPRPQAPAVNVSAIPAEMKALDRWVLWRYKWTGSKWTKEPVQQNGRNASTTDPKTWTTFETAFTACRGIGFDGIGFVLGKLTDGRVVFGLDLDGCRDPQTGELAAWARELLRLVPDTYAEVSPSLEGVKLLGYGSKPGDKWSKTAYHDGAVELYDHDRFFTTTGIVADVRDQRLCDEQDGVGAIYNLVWAYKAARDRAESKAKSNGHARENCHQGKAWSSYWMVEHKPAHEMSDEEVVERIKGGRKAALWGGSTAGYPSWSEAALALCDELRFWGGRDAGRIDRLFRQSGLMLPKWDSPRKGSTWGRLYAIDLVIDDGNVYDPDRHGKAQSGDHSSDSSDSPDQPWGDIIPLGEPPPPPPFPIDVLPGPFRGLVEEGAEAMNAPPDYLAVPLLVMAGGALGASRALSITESHSQRAALYAAVVGPPGSAKSPALKAVTTPAREKQAQNLSAWQALMEEYDEQRRAYEQARKKTKQPDGEAAPSKPRRPILERLLVSDATTEALAPILMENPRGVVLMRDELTAWVGSMNAYRDKGRGADRQFWLSVWDGSSAEVDRKKDHDKGPIIVPHPFIGVVGGMTPSGLRNVRGDVGGRKADDDGFIDRVLFSYPLPTRARGETWASIRKATADLFRDAMDRLRLPEMVDDGHGGRRPHFIHLDKGACEAWQRFTDCHAAEVNADDFPDHLKGPWSKLRGYGGRLALIVHYLRWAACEIDSDRANADERDVLAAASLLDYFKGHARRVYASIDADSRVAAARKVLEWIKRERPVQFKRWQAYKDLESDSLFPTAESLDPALELLERHNYVRAHTPPRKANRGRLPDDVYFVNPAAHRENRENRNNGD